MKRTKQGNLLSTQMLSAAVFLILILLCKHLSCDAYVSNPKSMVKFLEWGPLLPPRQGYHPKIKISCFDYELRRLLMIVILVNIQNLREWFYSGKLILFPNLCSFQNNPQKCTLVDCMRILLWRTCGWNMRQPGKLSFLHQIYITGSKLYILIHIYLLYDG